MMQPQTRTGTQTPTPLMRGTALAWLWSATCCAKPLGAAICDLGGGGCPSLSSLLLLLLLLLPVLSQLC